ncbi:MAG: 2-hydroxyacid dehydrogenase [Lachnospiraceae bacterium]|nr:2-hydroxyacid dehydrogenase [Lachnospiraceae bacterium]
MNITFFGTKPYDRMWFEEMGKQYGFPIRFFEVNLSEETVALAQGADAICVFVNDDVNGKVIAQLAEFGVKTILLRCAGFNQVDLKTAQKHDIKVLRVPGYSPEAVAEFSMGLLLAVNRQIPRAYVRTRMFNMNIHGLMGHDLKNRTVGIIGTGKIGQAMIQICKGFGMRILAYDIYPVDGLDVEYVSLDELFERSDVISLHCPLTKDNYHMIDRRTLKKMKDGVYIINTSRGALIDAKALVEALRLPGKIGGVALDVYEEEGGIFYEDKSNDIVDDDTLARLLMFPNVLITSHQGYFTMEAMQAIAIETMENAYAVKQGNPCPNEVTL